MANVKLGIGLQNQMSKELDKIARQLSRVQTDLDKAQTAGDRLGNVRLSTVTRGLGNAQKNVDSLKGKVNELNQEVTKAEKGFGGWSKGIIVANQAIGLISSIGRGVGSILKVSDTYMQTNARIGLINDGLKTSKQLQDDIYQSAKRSRSSYADMADSVSKMGLLAPEAFKNNQELIKFNELLNKSGKISGADPAQTAGAVRQLTQGLSAGALRGDEYISVSENLPMVKNAIAKYLNVSNGGLRELASQGKITADIIKEAMFEAGDDIEAMFKAMPVTFADSATAFKDILHKNLGDVGARILPQIQEFMIQLTTLLNTAEVQNFLTGIGLMIIYIGEGLMWLIQVLSQVFNFVVNNWPTISAILMMIAMVYLPTLIKTLAIAGITSLKAGLLMFKSWVIGLGPIMWVIMAIIAVLGILKLLGVSFEKIFGFIGGVVGVTVAIIMNIFIGLYNGIATIINGIAYGFEVMGWGIRTAITAVVNFVLDQVLKVARIIDKVFGSDLSSKVKNMQGNMKKWAGDMPEFKEVVKTAEYVSLEDAWKKGSDIGGKIGKGADDLVGKAQNLFKGLGAIPNEDSLVNNGSVPVSVEGGKLDSAGKVDVSEEDLKMLKDIATKEFMLKYKQVSPTMNVSFGDVKETADVNIIKKMIEKMTEEELANMYLEEVTVE